MTGEDKEDKKVFQRDITRRCLLTGGAAIAGAALATTALMPGVAAAADWVKGAGRATGVQPRYQQARYAPGRYHFAPRSLSFFNLHTGESLKTVYFEDGAYVPDALHAINYFFRDWRANEIKPIEPRLLDLLHAIHYGLQTSKPFNLISGYRSAATNAMLAAHSEGVARHSMHIEGKAADINVPGRQLSMLQRIALALQFGGVGFYPQSDFVHVDTGRVRRW